MPGGASAVTSGDQLKKEVVALGNTLELDARTEVKVAKRIWGSDRRIDVVLTHRDSRKTLGIECKYQAVAGTAEEKVPTTIQDMAAWPIPGLLVFDGPGFTDNMKAFLISTGKAVELSDLEPWLRLFFGLDVQ